MKHTHLDPAASCSLSDEARTERLAWIRSEILPHAIRADRGGDAINWELDEAPGLAERLDRLIALERECCSDLDIAHVAPGKRTRRRLVLRGVDPASPLLAGLATGSTEPSDIAWRIVRAAGLGTFAGVVVCCVLPIAAGAALGAAAAASFAPLDDPWIILGASLLFGSAAFLWHGRRGATARTDHGESPEETEGAPGCSTRNCS